MFHLIFFLHAFKSNYYVLLFHLFLLFVFIKMYNTHVYCLHSIRVYILYVSKLHFYLFRLYSAGTLDFRISVCSACVAIRHCIIYGAYTSVFSCYCTSQIDWYFWLLLRNKKKKKTMPSLSTIKGSSSIKYCPIIV